jgi:hypothetical protein
MPAFTIAIQHCNELLVSAIREKDKKGTKLERKK